MVGHGVEDLLLGYRIGHGACKRDRAGHGCYCEDEVPAFAAKKNSTCLVAYVNLVSKLASVFFGASNLCILEITYII
jgi:hypothetical protein